MNSIPTDQNSERQLQRLAAQRHLYATAKTVFGWQVLISGPVAVVFAFCAIYFPQLKGYAALWGIIVSICDIAWLTPWQKRLRNTAAQVQELFDCDVLALPWVELKAGRRPDSELVKEQAEIYRWKSKSMPPLTNWYPKEVGSVPLYIARLICQRSNCWWDAKQRRHYASRVIVGVVAVFIAVLCLALGSGFTIEDFVIKVAAPLSPILILGFRQFTEQMEAATRLDKLKEHVELLWAATLSGKAEAEVTASARGLQDEILENRKRSPLVFDGSFKRIRGEYQVQMMHGAAELVAEARQRLGL